MAVQAFGTYVCFQEWKTSQNRDFLYLVYLGLASIIFNILKFCVLYVFQNVPGIAYYSANVSVFFWAIAILIGLVIAVRIILGSRKETGRNKNS
jgi:hypothetical protein